MLVHKLTRQPLLESPIVLPTIQQVDNLKEIDSVRTPIDHVPANYDGKALNVLLHRQDEARLQELPSVVPSTQGKSSETLATQASKWRALGKKYSELADQAEQTSKGEIVKPAVEIVEEQKKTPTASIAESWVVRPKLRKVVRDSKETFKQVQNDPDLGLFAHQQQV